MTKGLKYLLIAIVVLFLVFLNMAGGAGFLIAFPLYYALFALVKVEVK